MTKDMIFWPVYLKTAIDEMIHIEDLAEHILFLKGEVEMKTSQEVKKIHDEKRQ